MRAPVLLLSLLVLTAGCSGQNEPPADTAPAEVAPSLGIRPNGDTEIQPDLTQVSEELQQVFAYIDEHIDEDVIRLQRELQQPSISNTGEGIPETAQRVRGYFEELGCQESTVHEVGETEWGAQGNPVVYAKCDVGAERTLLLYWMYDTMPITQPDLWNYPPFDATLVEQPPFPKVVIARGAVNSKGPQMAQLNALMAIKAVTGTAAGQLDHRGRGRRGAHVDWVPQVRPGEPRALCGGRGHVPLRRPGLQWRRLDHRRLRGLRLHRAHDVRRQVGTRAHLRGHPRLVEALVRQSRDPSYHDAVVAVLGGRQPPRWSTASTTTSSRWRPRSRKPCSETPTTSISSRWRVTLAWDAS